jgi:hypothetical protein
VLDEGQVVELWVKRTRHRTIVGNIYKGRVTKAARDAVGVCRPDSSATFLYVSTSSRI